MVLLNKMSQVIGDAIKKVFDHELSSTEIKLAPTKKEFSGDYTYVVFPLVKELRQAPDKIAQSLGEYLEGNSDYIKTFNVVKGFLNLEMTDKFWQESFSEIKTEGFGTSEANGHKMIVEYSSPNTNKPLHLGHIRNILLGWSISQIASNRGYEVVKTQIINDRGIAVCKSMMAWKLFGNGTTPQEAKMKGDHFVGDFYVKFDKALQEEYKSWQEAEGLKVYADKGKEKENEADFFKRFKNQYFNEYSVLGRDTKDMLIDWEKGDADTVALWKKMNAWVYEGFDETYANLGVSFDTINYESETYLLGKKTVEEGLEKGIFYRLDDGSVWIDLEDAGMDKKIVLRSDGTSVYMTQDVGTAQMRYDNHKMDSMVYVVGDEQDYHFKVLFEILKRLGEPYADKLYHLSYGMVDLPTGKMKSREGTVVDADDLIAEVVTEARTSSEERGAVAHLSESKQDEIYRKIGLAALKYFIIKINPKKRMVFDPKESVDMQGTTGPYIQNAYVRIQSILRKAEKTGFQYGGDNSKFEANEMEKSLIAQMIDYPETLDEALAGYDPSVVANYCYNLAKAFHRYYHDNVILDENNPELSAFRMELASVLSGIIEKGMLLLGIEMPEYM